jgi:hypothetical protein
VYTNLIGLRIAIAGVGAVLALQGAGVSDCGGCYGLWNGNKQHCHFLEREQTHASPLTLQSVNCSFTDPFFILFCGEWNTFAVIKHNQVLTRCLT